MKAIDPRSLSMELAAAFTKPEITTYDSGFPSREFEVSLIGDRLTLEHVVSGRRNCLAVFLLNNEDDKVKALEFTSLLVDVAQDMFKKVHAHE